MIIKLSIDKDTLLWHSDDESISVNDISLNNNQIELEISYPDPEVEHGDGELY